MRPVPHTRGYEVLRKKQPDRIPTLRKLNCNTFAHLTRTHVGVITWRSSNAWEHQEHKKRSEMILRFRTWGAKTSTELAKSLSSFDFSSLSLRPLQLGGKAHMRFIRSLQLDGTMANTTKNSSPTPSISNAQPEVNLVDSLSIGKSTHKKFAKSLNLSARTERDGGLRNRSNSATNGGTIGEPSTQASSAALEAEKLVLSNQTKARLRAASTAQSLSSSSGSTAVPRLGQLRSSHPPSPQCVQAYLFERSSKGVEAPSGAGKVDDFTAARSGQPQS